MNTLPLISSNLTSIIMLIFTVFLIRRNILVNKFRTRFFVLAAITNILLLGLEIGDIYFANNNFQNVYIIRNIINTLGFAISPFLAYFLVIFNNFFNNKLKKLWSIPLYINIIICIINMKTGWVFYIIQPNEYFRGSLFAIPLCVCLFYTILLISVVIKNNKEEYDLDDIGFIIGLTLTIIACTILQISITGIIVTWSTAAVGMILYFIFLREMQFKYDKMTGIKNRDTFEKEIRKKQKIDKVGIVVMDLNNLKQINDEKGHAEGDIIIIKSSKIISDCFKTIGSCYRIGGDEFCVICNDCSEKSLARAVLQLENKIEDFNNSNDRKIQIAYGYSIFDKNKDISIFHTFTEADEAMYKHKSILKN